MFELTQRGHADFAFIGGAQIDMYGNGEFDLRGGTYTKAATRFPGSGGAGAMAANCEKSIIIMALEPRRFVNQVDFRDEHRLWRRFSEVPEDSGVMGSGPYRVITMRPFRVRRRDPSHDAPGNGAGKNRRGHQKKVSFELLISPDLQEMKEPGRRI